MKKKYICILIFILMIMSGNIKSQTRDTSENSKSILSVLKDTTYYCTVITGSRSVYKEVKLFSLKDSTVNILKEDITSTIALNNIRTIKFKGKGFLQELW